MITARKFQFSDRFSIDRIYRKSPEIGIPSLSNSIINTTLVDGGDKIVGYGIVKNFPEAVLKLDPDLRPREKVRALQAAMNVAIKGSKLAREEYLYVISNEFNFTRVLKNHFGFVDCPGDLLVLDLGKE